MNSIVHGAVGCLLACCLVSVACGEDLDDRPRLRFEPSQVDFGEVFEHQSARAEVLVVNEGDARVEFKDLRESCDDCLDVMAGKALLNPGDSTTLSLLFDPTGREGEVSEYAVIDTGVHSGGLFVLSVRALVSSPYRIHSGSLLLEAADEQDSVSSSVRVTPLIDMQGTFTSGCSVGGRVKATVSPDLRVPGDYEVRVSAVTPVESGMAEDEIILQSTHAGDPNCRIPASVFLAPPIHIFPSRLRVSPTDREQLRILFIESRVFNDVELLSVRVPDERVRWEYFPGSGLARSRLNVYITAVKGLDGELGDIELLVRGDEEQTVRIPVVVDPGKSSTVYFSNAKAPLGSRKGCGCGSGS